MGEGQEEPLADEGEETPAVPYAFDSAVLEKNAKANSEQLPVQWTNDGGAAWAFDEDAHWWHSRYAVWENKGDHLRRQGLLRS